MKTLILILMLFVGASAQVVIEGNPKCADLGFNRELKVEDPTAGSYPVTGFGNITITVNSPNTLSWTAESNFITAVIMKGGPRANVYFYDPPSSGADMLTTPNGRDTSHVTFCYNVSPTSAPIGFSGKVTSFYGRPVKGATVLLTNAATGEAKSALTNPMGYFSIQDLQVGDLYVIVVRAKGLEFLPQNRILNDSVVDEVIMAIY